MSGKEKISDFNKKYVEKSCLKTCELKVVNKLLKCISLDLRIETKSIKNTVNNPVIYVRRAENKNKLKKVSAEYIEHTNLWKVTKKRP